jgi:hypothetical protein
MKKCFIIMPITLPDPEVEHKYLNDIFHFTRVLEHLFVPAINNAGFRPVSPVTEGSKLIHADIINNLKTSDIVLCDMSALNPNVFFELGIRTALNKPVCMVVDHLTDNVPFDTSLLNYYKYNAYLQPWFLPNDIIGLTEHIRKSGLDCNSFWECFK